MKNVPYTYLYLGKGKVEKLSKPISGYVYYKNSRECLLTGKVENYSFLEFLETLDNQLARTKTNDHRIIHLFYEAGHFLVQSREKDLLRIQALQGNGHKDILAIDIQYEKSIIKDTPLIEEIIKFNSHHTLNNIDYKNSFHRGIEKLKKGECYQFNLTFPETYQIETIPERFENLFFEMIQNKDVIGAFAHSTYIPSLKKGLISNSPECLFQAKFKKDHLHLWTMPIKGTICNRNNKTSENWQKLSTSKKDEGELNMITDLLRNDLSRIDRPNAKVIKKKELLKVPNLLHQFSLIDVKLSLETKLGKILHALFPGGSITGAPKKNVMSILDQLENGERRGFYTGSTILCDRNRLVASINIRSAECDLKSETAKISAGGGITLLSECHKEQQEMEDKRQSFLQLFH